MNFSIGVVSENMYRAKILLFIEEIGLIVVLEFERLSEIRSVYDPK